MRGGSKTICMSKFLRSYILKEKHESFYKCAICEIEFDNTPQWVRCVYWKDGRPGYAHIICIEMDEYEKKIGGMIRDG